MSLGIACTSSIFNSRWKTLQAEKLSRGWVSQKWEKAQENREKLGGQMQRGSLLTYALQGIISTHQCNTIPRQCNMPREYQSLAERQGLCPESVQMWGENSAGIKPLRCNTSILGWSQHGCLMLQDLAKQPAIASAASGALCPQIFMKQRGGFKCCRSLPLCYDFLGMLWIF